MSHPLVVFSILELGEESNPVETVSLKKEALCNNLFTASIKYDPVYPAAHTHSADIRSVLANRSTHSSMKENIVDILAHHMMRKHSESCSEGR